MNVVSTRPREAVVAYRARFDECGPDAVLRASSLLRWAQDIAWIHSERLGFGREWYADRGIAWVVRGLELVVLVPIRMGTTVEVLTQVSGFRRVMARRRTEVRDGDGTLVAWGLTDWVMTDVTRGVPIRVPADFPALFDSAMGGFEPTRVAAGVEPPDAFRRDIRVRPQELDPMAHANNAAYVDWLEEALLAAGRGDVSTALPRTYRLEYFLPAGPSEDLTATVWPDGDDMWRFRLSDAAGRDRFRATLSTAAG